MALKIQCLTEDMKLSMIWKYRQVADAFIRIPNREHARKNNVAY